MKTRKEVAEFIEQQMWAPEGRYPRKYGAWNYGRAELRDLLDFIYGGPPLTEHDKLFPYHRVEAYHIADQEKMKAQRRVLALQEEIAAAERAIEVASAEKGILMDFCYGNEWHRWSPSHVMEFCGKKLLHLRKELKKHEGRL